MKKIRQTIRAKETSGRQKGESMKSKVKLLLGFKNSLLLQL